MLTELLGYAILFVFSIGVLVILARILDEFFRSDDPWK